MVSGVGEEVVLRPMPSVDVSVEITQCRNVDISSWPYFGYWFHCAGKPENLKALSGWGGECTLY